jgi:purine-cytosine permease-like protein
MRKIYDALRLLVCTKLGWLIISMIWGGIFLVIDNTQDSYWALILAAPAVLYVVGLFGETIPLRFR